MGLFDKKTSKEEQTENLKKFMDKYQFEDLDEKDLIVLERIANDLLGNSSIKTGMTVNFAEAEEQANVTYLAALIEQNWMIIRQLSRLNKNIEELKNKE